jgi:hypothetical protein
MKMVDWCVLLVLLTACNLLTVTQCSNSISESDEEYYDDSYGYEESGPKTNTTAASAKQIFFIRQYLLNDITFKYYDRNGELALSVSAYREPRQNETQCDPSGKFAIIVHGWNETCTTREWVTDLVTSI